MEVHHQACKSAVAMSSATMAAFKRIMPGVAKARVTLLEDKLFWAASDAAATSDAYGRHVVQIHELCDLTYKIEHYHPKQYGRAFGPLNIVTVLYFCRALKKILLQHPCVTVVTPSFTNENEVWQMRSNVAVLFGAYLMLLHGKSPRDLAVIMEPEAHRRFVCSWQRAADAKRILRVQDCWAGFAVACQLGWIRSETVGCDSAVESDCQTRAQMARCYDASWIGNNLMVCADPVTTIHDPNPVTVKTLVPPAPARAPPSVKLSTSRKPSLRGTEIVAHVSRFLASPKSIGSGFGNIKSSLAAYVNEDQNLDDKDQNDPDGDITPRPSMTPTGGRSEFSLQDITPRPPMTPGGRSEFSLQSCDTVCKEYTEFSQSMPMLDECAPVVDFATFWSKACRVAGVIRCNYSDEPGMPVPSYEPSELEDFGIQHTEIPFDDTRGGLPGPNHVRMALLFVDTLSPASAVAVHCKGGFGRSMAIACCILIDRLDIPGRALLGWVRMARPGAVNTIEQEKFIVGFNGKADVRKFAGLEEWCNENPQTDVTQTSSKVSCHGDQCCLQ